MAGSGSAKRVLGASLIGTAVEFYDFYIYATAAVLVFPKLFFHAADAATATLQSLATFALAIFASLPKDFMAEGREDNAPQVRESL